MSEIVDKLTELSIHELNFEDLSGFTLENLYKDATKFYKGLFF